MKNAKTKTVFWIGGLVVACLAIALLAGLTTRASSNPSDYLSVERWFSTPDERTEGNYPIYSVRISDYSFKVERWKYVIRNDATCTGSIFRNNGQDAGNYSNVVYINQNRLTTEPTPLGTQADISYRPSSDTVANDYNGKYICFAIRAVDGRWPTIGSQLDFSTGVRTTPTITVSPKANNWQVSVANSNSAFWFYSDSCSKTHVDRVENSSKRYFTESVNIPYLFTEIGAPGGGATTVCIVAVDSNNNALHWLVDIPARYRY